jgi:hypothetical protein
MQNKDLCLTDEQCQGILDREGYMEWLMSRPGVDDNFEPDPDELTECHELTQVMRLRQRASWEQEQAAFEGECGFECGDIDTFMSMEENE